MGKLQVWGFAGPKHLVKYMVFGLSVHENIEKIHGFGFQPPAVARAGTTTNNQQKAKYQKPKPKAKYTKDQKPKWLTVGFGFILALQLTTDYS